MLGRLQYRATDANHIIRRIRRMLRSQREELRNAFEYGPLGPEWGDNLISACQQMGWQVR